MSRLRQWIAKAGADCLVHAALPSPELIADVDEIRRVAERVLKARCGRVRTR